MPGATAEPDPVWRACVESVRRRLGDGASLDLILWSTTFAYLLAVGALSEASVSMSLH